MGILIQGQIENVTTRKDGTIKLTVGMQEFPPEKMGELFSLNNKLINTYISSKGIKQDMIDEIDKATVDILHTVKSPSKRLKAVFYLLWEKDSSGYDDFELYYRNKMEQVLDFYKLKIDE